MPSLATLKTAGFWLKASPILALLLVVGWLYLDRQHWREKAADRAVTINMLAAENVALKENAAALDRASTDRAADTSTITSNRKDRDDAIAAAKPSPVGSATLAANCVRWKAQHPNTATPAACAGYSAGR